MTDTTTTLFTVGARVAPIVNEHTHPYDLDLTDRGTVVAILPEPMNNASSPTKIVIKWDDHKYAPGEITEHSSNELMLEADAAKLLEEWKRLENAVKDKMIVAATAINEAQAIAKANNRDLTELHSACYVLEDAMDKAGWTTSSWYC